MNPNQKAAESIAAVILYGKSVSELEQIRDYILSLIREERPALTSAERLALNLVNEALAAERSLQVIRDAVDSISS